MPGPGPGSDASNMRVQAWLRVRLDDERGMALVMAVGIAAVLLIAGATAIAASTSASKESVQSRSRQSAFSMAESGINNSMAVLNLPTNNALDQDTLPGLHEQPDEVLRPDGPAHLDLDVAPQHLPGRQHGRLLRDASPQRMPGGT